MDKNYVFLNFNIDKDFCSVLGDVIEGWFEVFIYNKRVIKVIVIVKF